MLPAQFIAKWQAAELTERSAYQQHFLDLCDLLGQPKPADVDQSGAWYTFEKGVTKADGGKGFADVWMKGHFGWEYKGKKKNLADAYRQLSQYREALANPPLLIVCDLNRFEVHTNFTGTVKETAAFDLAGLAESKNLDTLRAAFTDPDKLRPRRTQKQVTEDVAGRFAALADALRGRGVPNDDAAHFLMKLMFCMFAEDLDGLLPPNLFLRTVTAAKGDAAKLSAMLRDLFGKMAVGGLFGAEDIPFFNGGLFKDTAAIDLTPAEIDILKDAAGKDWSQVEPSVLGTLFERSLDERKRSQIGAHYTSREDIETLLEPVMMAPLRREWEAVRAKADKAKGKKFEKLVNDFLHRLATVTVLDPACGSGNFLYVAIRLLLGLEKEVITYASARGVATLFPGVRPTQLRGIEVNPTARELAQVSIWIGFLQWMKFNGFVNPSDPILDPMETIQNRDAVIDLSDPAAPVEPQWPAAEFIVGNPPFLGDKKMRAELGDVYVESLRKLYDGRLPGQSDLCCYWFEKARAAIEKGRTKRAGLIATQGIRGGANRVSLDRIKQTGGIFSAWADRDWVLDGATVHVSMVGFDDGAETAIHLDGKPVASIHSDLKSGDSADVTTARLLTANESLCFLGVMKAGAFDVNEPTALAWLQDANPHGKPNSDVLRPRLTARDILQRAATGWIIDFGCGGNPAKLCLYEAPWKYVETHVKPERDKSRDDAFRTMWWQFGRPRPALRERTHNLARFVVTPEVSKHRIFTWLDDVYLADHQTRAFTDGSDEFFGVLHSRVHELWARAKGTQLREVESGFRYTPTTCFETFPFPSPTPAQRDAIAAAAKDLDALRSNWLNPPEWTRTETLVFPGSVGGPWRRYVTEPNDRGVGTVRYPRLVPEDGDAAAKLKKRTLTALYNERPAWLANAHARLDAAVAAAYGWPADLAADEVLARLLALNLSGT